MAPAAMIAARTAMMVMLVLRPSEAVMKCRLSLLYALPFPEKAKIAAMPGRKKKRAANAGRRIGVNSDIPAKNMFRL